MLYRSLYVKISMEMLRDLNVTVKWSTTTMVRKEPSVLPWEYQPLVNGTTGIAVGIWQHSPHNLGETIDDNAVMKTWDYILELMENIFTDQTSNRRWLGRQALLWTAGSVIMRKNWNWDIEEWTSV